MSNKNPVNIAASVLARLKNLAVQRGWNFMHMLTRYGIERFLFRLGASEYARQFVVKGGNMFVIWQNGNNSRPTIDSDLLCYGDVSDEHLKQVFTELCNMSGIPGRRILAFQISNGRSQQSFFAPSDRDNANGRLS